MKSIYKNALMTVAGVASLAIVGCKKFLDVNDNPNAPTTATDNIILPSTQAAVGMVLGNSFQIYGSFFAQYWTQNPFSSQYKVIDQYELIPTDFNRSWGTLYSAALQDIKTLERSGNSSYAAIALIEKAYVYQILTDAFGDVPLKEALKGVENLSPHYDSQREVYDSIFAWAKRGIAILKAPAVGPLPSTEDLIFGGGAAGNAQWIRFGNTLLLRAYLRLSQVDAAKSMAGVKELYDNSAQFLEIDAKIKYLNVGGNQNPLYAEGVGLGRVDNIVASATSVNAFKDNNDPRLDAFYSPTGIGMVVGIPQGSFITIPDDDSVPSAPSPSTGGNFSTATAATAGTAPVKLISAAESYFLQAEAVARGWGTGNAKTLFESGIKASFDAYGVAGLADYMLNARDAKWEGDMQNHIRLIITQKYYAMCGVQGFEAWTEWRRTGYPSILVKSRASRLGTNDLPVRFIYPNTEVTRNSNFPGVKPVTEKVWWDR